MEWCDRPFIDYLNVVNNELLSRFNISSTDDEDMMEIIESCYECDDEPEECARIVAENYWDNPTSNVMGGDTGVDADDPILFKVGC